MRKATQTVATGYLVIVSAVVLVSGMSTMQRSAPAQTILRSEPFSGTFVIRNATSSPLCTAYPCEVLDEAPSPELSAHPDWWLNSGGDVIFEDSIGRTLHGTIPDDMPWRFAYALSNPLDTVNGYRPQNVFRLLTKKRWRDVSMELYARIRHYEADASVNRDESDGVFLLGRYLNESNLYSVGMRVDGALVIKKKSNGIYRTLAYRPFFFNGSDYDRTKNPSLLPEDNWLGLRAEFRNIKNGVKIRFFVDPSGEGDWTPALETYDLGSLGDPPHTGESSLGIRTDFMDVDFKNPRINPL